MKKIIDKMVDRGKNKLTFINQKSRTTGDSVYQQKMKELDKTQQKYSALNLSDGQKKLQKIILCANRRQITDI